MKKRILFILMQSVFFCLFSQEKESSPPQWVFNLASSVNLELVYGDKYPYLNSYISSYGSPIVSDFISSEKLIFDKEIGATRNGGFNYMLFYGRKKKESFNKSYSSEESIHFNYTYFLIFVVDEGIGGDFKVKDVFEVPGLVGMQLHYEKINKDLSEFRYLKNLNLKGPKGISSKNGSRPIILMTENSMEMLVYYNGAWLSYIESY